MADVEQRLCFKLDGSPLGASTSSRYRSVSRACIRRAVELDILESGPWPPASGRVKRRKSQRNKKVDIRILLGPVRMREALAAIETQQPASKRCRVMTSVMYYGGLRPSEAVMLRPQALKLPKSGRAWHRALRTIGEETRSLYHCRHAAATTWLGASVSVSTHVGALTGDEAPANILIDRALEQAALEESAAG